MLMMLRVFHPPGLLHSQRELHWTHQRGSEGATVMTAGAGVWSCRGTVCCIMELELGGFGIFMGGSPLVINIS